MDHMGLHAIAETDTTTGCHGWWCHGLRRRRSGRGRCRSRSRRRQGYYDSHRLRVAADGHELARDPAGAVVIVDLPPGAVFVLAHDAVGRAPAQRADPRVIRARAGADVGVGVGDQLRKLRRGAGRRRGRELRRRRWHGRVGGDHERLALGPGEHLAAVLDRDLHLHDARRIRRGHDEVRVGQRTHLAQQLAVGVLDVPLDQKVALDLLGLALLVAAHERPEIRVQPVAGDVLDREALEVVALEDLELVAQAGRVFEPDRARVALVILIAIDISADVGVVDEAARRPAGDQRQVERLARLDDGLVGCDPADERLERVAIAFLEQIAAGQLHAAAGEDRLDLEPVDLAHGVAQQSVELPAGDIGARVDRRGDAHGVGQHADGLPVISAGVEAILGDLAGRFHAHAELLVLRVQPVGEQLEELVELPAQVLVQPAVVQVDALVQVADRQIDERVDVRIALRGVDEHVRQQVGADDGAVVVADDGRDRERAAELVERRIDRAVDRAVPAEIQAGRMHLGQRATAVRRQVAGQGRIHRDQCGLGVGLHDHQRGRHGIDPALDLVILADDGVRQPLPLLGRAVPGVHVQRLIRLAVVGDGRDPDRLRRRLAAQGQLIEGAFRHEVLRDGLCRVEQVVPRVAGQERHPRDGGEAGAEGPRNRAGIEDHLCPIRVAQGAAGLGDPYRAQISHAFDQRDGRQEQRCNQ
ncbi:MAG: hypothetical protein BWY52_02585 [Chloroflexi bacterium ADurb.Bin325]|nr:MAG: hypothetical protein BWY52_02585 [Chloroflexi bacterium ADurb.Bin325]